MSIELSVATPADDASIRALLRRQAVPGRITISYQREPEFDIGCRASGENIAVLVARNHERTVVGVACKSEREVFVNGVPTRLGYLSQLRIDPAYRGRWLLARGYALLRSLHEDKPVPAYIAAVTASNREAEGVLIDRRRKWFPSFHAVADYNTFAVMTTAGARSEERVQAASIDDLSEIIDFLRREGANRQFFPVWTRQRVLELINNLGLRIEDLRIERRDGQIAGVIALWDQSAYKQNVVHSYSNWMKCAAPFYNSAAPLIGRPRLPRPGEQIRSGYASFVCIARDDEAVFRRLLAATMERAARRGLDYLLVGLDTRDPFVKTVRTLPHILYRSRLYLAEWPKGDSLHARLDWRPSNIELATL